jgi:CoA:oxalate CoA-transferase
MPLRRPAPDLGVDTETVLREFGYSPEEIARLRQDGVV